MLGIKTSLTTLFAVGLTWTPAFAGQGEQYHGMFYGMHGMFMGPIMMLIALVVIVIIVVLIVRWVGGSGHGAVHAQHVSHGKSPLDILRERFARGEIDKQEFEERRQVLEE